MTKQESLGLLALHSGAVPPLRFDELTGLIGCPSFHTVIAILTGTGSGASLGRDRWRRSLPYPYSCRYRRMAAIISSTWRRSGRRGRVDRLRQLALRQRMEQPVLAREAFA